MSGAVGFWSRGTETVCEPLHAATNKLAEKRRDRVMWELREWERER
jgi:hypothetical protein